MFFCILHPTPLNVKKWNFNNFLKIKKIIYVGVHCRNLEFFCNLSKNKIGEFDYVYLAAKNEIPEIVINSKVAFSKRLNRLKYNEILTKSIIFLQLTSATANNTILECIARGTPIIVNLSDGVSEYLGKNYPLYYRNYEEAINLINKIKNNPEMLIRVKNYLDRMAYKFNRHRFTKKLKNKIEKCI